MQRERTDRADSTYDTQEEAIEHAVELAGANDGQVRVKGENGQTRGERTYGDDPYPPKG